MTTCLQKMSHWAVTRPHHQMTNLPKQVSSKRIKRSPTITNLTKQNPNLGIKKCLMKNQFRSKKTTTTIAMEINSYKPPNLMLRSKVRV